ncbi:hypothetical protein E2562_019689 [Oryza meyeriana var. granulata]|uniref:Disease resistance N-terminal domain-containing protein n=1 Tax=Oryza meyeriana var. granulata TaxID=110450 RepID=A0A6G1C9C7_9ORYZ|nr:hypothetical protein E2562_019689 [Oryza meyeriana var. granulata]
MDDLMSARGAVNCVLTNAYGALAKEVKLLRGVRRVVQFIKDEMESMNAFLIKITEGNGDDDPQVRAWMNQVKEVANKSDYYICKYMSCLDSGRTARFLFTILAGHTNPRPQGPGKASEVSERQQRYGVTALAAYLPPAINKHRVVELDATGKDEDLEERRILVDDDSDLFKEAAEELRRPRGCRRCQRTRPEDEGHPHPRAILLLHLRTPLRMLPAEEADSRDARYMA